LEEEEAEVSLHRLQCLCQKFYTIKDLPKATQPKKPKRAIRAINESLWEDDELAVRNLMPN